MYITGDRGNNSLLIKSIRTWSSPELMMKHLWNEYNLKFVTAEHPASYKFESFLDSRTYSGVRVYFSSTNQDIRVRLLKSDELIDLAKLLKYIQ